MYQITDDTLKTLCQKQNMRDLYPEDSSLSDLER